TLEIVVRGVYSPEGIVPPVAIEGIHDVRMRDTADAEPLPVGALVLEAQRAADRALSIAAGLIGARDPRIVDRPGVVAVVQVRIQQRERRVQLRQQIATQFAA